MKVLVINAGSSSLKYQLLDPETGHLLAKGLCERIGIDGKFTYKPQVEGKAAVSAADVPRPTHSEAIQAVLSALVDPDNGCYEPFQIVRTLDDQTIKTDRVLETAFRNYFPISPTVMGTCGGDGRYCLRVRDDGTACKWLVRWEVQGTARFRTVDFRQEPHPHLEEGGG